MFVLFNLLSKTINIFSLPSQKKMKAEKMSTLEREPQNFWYLSIKTFCWIVVHSLKFNSSEQMSCDVTLDHSDVNCATLHLPSSAALHQSCFPFCRLTGGPADRIEGGSANELKCVYLTKKKRVTSSERHSAGLPW